MMNSLRFTRLSIMTAALGLLAGCNVGPKYVRPNVTAPPAYRGADDSASSSQAKDSLGDEQWAAVYHEPELQELIRKALANNYDVRIAAQTNPRATGAGEESRARRSFRPSLLAEPVSARPCHPLSATQFPNPLVEGSLNLSAAWTPDFWGLYRRQTEAARAQLLAQVWAQRAVQMTLVQQVATAYLQIRALDAQLRDHPRDAQSPAGFRRPDQDP